MCVFSQSRPTLCDATHCSLLGASVQITYLEFPRQEYWSGQPFLTPGHFPESGIKPTSLASPALAGKFFTTEPPGKPFIRWQVTIVLSKSGSMTPLSNFLSGKEN